MPLPELGDSCQLPPGPVELRADPHDMNRLCVALPVPGNPGSQCWMGELLVHVDDARYDDPRQAISRSDLESGTCE